MKSFFLRILKHHTRNKESKMFHSLKTQEDCDRVVEALRASKKQSHILYVYAHGGDKRDLFDVLKAIKGGKYIFIDSLAAAIQDVMAAGKDVYVIANSCYWNLKYNWGFPTPTISFGPDKSTRLPFPSESLEIALAALPDEFEKSFFLEWVTKLQEGYRSYAKLVTSYDVNGNIVPVVEFRIIEAAA